MYNYILKPLLFLFPAETAHHLAMRSFKTILRIPIINTIIRRMFKLEDVKLKQTLFGIEFPNPIGLAAGFDKDGKYIDVLHTLGFGFIEVGTVTPIAQAGNPKPRLFRLIKDQALINRMGFNNGGLDALVAQLKKYKNKSIIIGGNIGKNKITPNELAYQDYTTCFDALHPYVNYFVINVSSPNTPGLRELQEKKPLNKILAEVQLRNQLLAQPKPILLKIAPDVHNDTLDDIIEVVLSNKLDGMILLTTKNRLDAIGAGGLSGAPLKRRSDELIAHVHKKTTGHLPIIGVGGILSEADAISKFDAGASLIQVYTGFIYRGPMFIKSIKKAILDKSSNHGQMA
ncbi:UNVERIFIED_CONTAM: hypothetical protein GTU68_042127 [Idotea baltica]|nr:hypothetical protein [Idotea baltica]